MLLRDWIKKNKLKYPTVIGKVLLYNDLYDLTVKKIVYKRVKRKGTQPHAAKRWMRYITNLEKFEEIYNSHL